MIYGKFILIKDLPAEGSSISVRFDYQYSYYIKSIL